MRTYLLRAPPILAIYRLALGALSVTVFVKICILESLPYEGEALSIFRRLFVPLWLTGANLLVLFWTGWLLVEPKKAPSEVIIVLKLLIFMDVVLLGVIWFVPM